MNEYQLPKGVVFKAPQDAVIPDVLPQERITGDVMRGYGPRRGNLERLLRYWRPIMRKPGGFRRCRVILADHPELYPLNNICAWLHHETTGLWPNEGCHHPNMKNCRKKLKKVTRGSLWSDNEFEDRLRKITSRQGGKSLSIGQENFQYDPFVPVVTNEDMEHAMKVLSDFVHMEKEFAEYVQDSNNWIHFGDDGDSLTIHDRVSAPGCTCGMC